MSYLCRQNYLYWQHSIAIFKDKTNNSGKHCADWFWQRYNAGSNYTEVNWIFTEDPFKLDILKYILTINLYKPTWKWGLLGSLELPMGFARGQYQFTILLFDVTLQQYDKAHISKATDCRLRKNHCTFERFQQSNSMLSIVPEVCIGISRNAILKSNQTTKIQLHVATFVKVLPNCAEPNLAITIFNVWISNPEICRKNKMYITDSHPILPYGEKVEGEKEEEEDYN